MADNERLICASHALLERTHGIRFDLPELGERMTGFVVRYNGIPHAYLNRCAHVPIELDWSEGKFFESGGQYLMYATIASSTFFDVNFPAAFAV